MEMDEFWKYYSSIGLNNSFDAEPKVLAVAVESQRWSISMMGWMTNALISGRQAMEF